MLALLILGKNVGQIVREGHKVLRLCQFSPLPLVQKQVVDRKLLIPVRIVNGCFLLSLLRQIFFRPLAAARKQQAKQCDHEIYFLHKKPPFPYYYAWKKRFQYARNNLKES